jgi:hypothetical protein
VLDVRDSDGLIRAINTGHNDVAIADGGKTFGVRIPHKVVEI